MPKLLDMTEWNDRFYCMAVLDDGSRIELKSETGKIYEQDFSDDGSNLTIGEAKVAD
jgi:hypothetical protein